MADPYEDSSGLVAADGPIGGGSVVATESSLISPVPGSRSSDSKKISEILLPLDTIKYVFFYGILTVSVIEILIYTVIYVLVVSGFLFGYVIQLFHVARDGEFESYESIDSQWSVHSAYSRHSAYCFAAIQSSFSAFSLSSHGSVASSLSLGSFASVGSGGGVFHGVGEIVFYVAMFWFVDSIGRMSVQVSDKWSVLSIRPTKEKAKRMLQWVSCGVGRGLRDESQDCMMDMLMMRVIWIIHCALFIFLGVVAGMIPLGSFVVGWLLKGYGLASFVAIVYYYKMDNGVLFSRRCLAEIRTKRFLMFSVGCSILSMIPIVSVWAPWIVCVAFIRYVKNDMRKT